MYATRPSRASRTPLPWTQPGLDGLADRSHRPHAHPAQTSPEVEAAICELRRGHPRWGQRRLQFELGRLGCPGPVPSLSTIYRVLVRHGLIDPVRRRRRREDYRRWERDRPMELWQLDIVGGITLASGAELKVVTGVDDHSRFCVIATVVRRATGRAVCLAFAEALQRFGVPEEVLTDNGKQFTGRFSRPRPAEVMFERICRENGIVARNTKPRTPTTTGKVERFHQILQRELLDDVEVWPDLEAVQTAVDAFRTEYNTNRPHQSLDMAFPADRFTTRPTDGQLPLRLPPALTTAVPVPAPRPAPTAESQDPPALPAPLVLSANGVDPVNLAVEITRTVPASGNLAVCGQQFWLGPARAGLVIGLWADTTVVHLLLDGVRLKTLPSRLTPAHLRQLLADGGRHAGPPPVTAGQLKPGAPVEVDRLVNAIGLVSLAGRQHPIGYHLAGRRVTIRLDRGVLHLLDTDRTLLRSLPNPLTPAEQARIRDARPAGPPPTPATQPLRVERRVSSRGVLVIASQKIHVGIGHAGQTLTVEAADTTFRVHDGDQLLTEVPRTTTKQIARFKVRKPEPPRQHTGHAR
ncbi:IS481 family transposase [Micromonospora eburnea]|uniref:Transposase InsO and inactivated derivatives n=1 Tax=Micromonospora eburnea TaxID=227316 RepID=A0A1C6U838_9ACTN|nr:Transposase InsO and inactivated derivatives [Micromonospora eburnea]